MVEITGKGVLSLEDDEHRQHRKMLTGAFSTFNVKKLEPVFQSKTKELGDILDLTISQNNGGYGVIDCTDVFSKATLDVIGVTVLGVELANLKSVSIGDKPSSQSKQVNSGKEYTFHDAYEIIFAQSFIGKILFFANAFVPTRWLPLEANREFAFATSWLRDVLGHLIRERYSLVNEARRSGKYETLKRDSRDLLSYIIEESMPGGPAEGIAEDNFLGHVRVHAVSSVQPPSTNIRRDIVASVYGSRPRYECRHAHLERIYDGHKPRYPGEASRRDSSAHRHKARLELFRHRFPFLS